MQIRCIRAQHRLQTGMPAEKGDSSAVAAGGKKQEHEAKGVKEEDTDCTARAAVLRLKVSVLKSPLHGDFSILVYLLSRTRPGTSQYEFLRVLFMVILSSKCRRVRALTFELGVCQGNARA
jgi:hypothetical protein